MAAQDVQWGLGSACLYTASGSSITVYWGIGSAFVLYEYVAAGGVPYWVFPRSSQVIGGGVA